MACQAGPVGQAGYYGGSFADPEQGRPTATVRITRRVVGSRARLTRSRGPPQTACAPGAVTSCASSRSCASRTRRRRRQRTSSCPWSGRWWSRTRHPCRGTCRRAPGAALYPKPKSTPTYPKPNSTRGLLFAPQPCGLGAGGRTRDRRALEPAGARPALPPVSSLAPAGAEMLSWRPWLAPVGGRGTCRACARGRVVT